MREPASDERPLRLSAEEVAARVGLEPERVGHLADVGFIERGPDGSFEPGDVHRVRLMRAFEDAGVPFDALLAASRAGHVSLENYDELHPPPTPLSPLAYGELAASLGAKADLLSRLYAAFGLAEPDESSRLTTVDASLLTDLAELVEASGHPDLALRAVRLAGETARRSSDAALDAYGEVVEQDDVMSMTVGEVYDRVFQPWARLARQWSRLAGWLAEKHLGIAIDTFSLGQTERVLEMGGFAPERRDDPPAVAFVDLSGFTRLTEERGDAEAARVALRLAEISADVAATHRGRVVKLLGDGVLLRFDDAAAGVAGTIAILQALPRAGLPSGHAGVAVGPLIARDGDVFGRTVNLAARLADAAPEGRILVTSESAAAIPSVRFTATDRGEVDLHGIGLVSVADIALLERDE